MRQISLRLVLFFLLLAPWTARAEHIERIFTLKDFGLYAVSSDGDVIGDAPREWVTALAKDLGLKRLTVIWYAPSGRYPDSEPLGASMLEYEKFSYWVPASVGDVANRNYVASLGYETNTAELSDSYAEDSDAADALYKGKMLDVRSGRIKDVDPSANPQYLTLIGEGGWEVRVFPTNGSVASIPAMKHMTMFSAQGMITGHKDKTIFMDAAIFFPLPPR